MNNHIILLKTLADPTRLKLLKLVLHEELCVCELQPLLQISQPAVSQHIAKLKAAGLIEERRAGVWTYYRGNHQKIEASLKEFASFLETEPTSIPALAGEVERRATLNRGQTCCDSKGVDEA